MLNVSYKPQTDFQRFLLDAKFAVTGQARPRQESLKKLGDLSYEIGDHLGYVFCAPESREVNHWIKEIAVWLNTASKACVLKTKSGKLPIEDFLERLFEWPAGEERDQSSIMKRVNMHLDPKEITRSLPHKDFQRAYIKLLTEVYEKGGCTPQLVRQVLSVEGWIV